MLKRILSVFLAIVLTTSFAGLFTQASAIGIVSVEIVQLPNKLDFYRGTDWDYGDWVLDESLQLKWRSNPSLISFFHNPGSGQFPERGMIDMTGLKLKVTYVGGSTSTITYKETKTGSLYIPNILVSPLNGTEYHVGTNTMEVYLAADIYKCDTYNIKLIDNTTPVQKQGDVNADNKINSSDALLVLQHAVSLITLTAAQKKAADMNSDGKLNSLDALMILNTAVS